MSKIKERLDLLLVEKNIFESREKARSAIMSRKVYVDGNIIDKAGEKVDINSNIEYTGSVMPYVSRGGYKLEKAIKEFGVNIEGKICFDIGASTGGFSDCMLQNGAIKVYAIDVGYGQLAWKLRIDKRVVCMERTNARYLKPENFSERGNMASIDVAFISLNLIIPTTVDLLDNTGEILALIKPQFEAGKDKVGKKGVVKDKSTHIEVIKKIVKVSQDNNLKIKNLSYSPIKGPEGNIEYLIYLSKDQNIISNISDEIIRNIVDEAHDKL